MNGTVRLNDSVQLDGKVVHQFSIVDPTGLAFLWKIICEQLPIIGKKMMRRVCPTNEMPDEFVP